MDVLWLALALTGCINDRGDKPVVPPVQKYLDAADQVLPPGVVGEPYQAYVTVEGGDPPYNWAVIDSGGLPKGLSLDPNGSVSGVPAEAGDFVFVLLASDSAGRAKRMVAALHIVLEPTVVNCGDKVRGSFFGNAFTFEGPDLTDLDNIAWLAVDLAEQELTTRVELVFDSVAITTLYVERPAEVIGSSNLGDHYVPYYLNPGVSAMSVPLDAGTDPSLTGYWTQSLIPMVLVGQSPGDWEMEVVCSDGPVFVDLLQFPTELGNEINTDFQVYGSNVGVRIWTEDPLPEWMIWDETTGTVTGTAMEVGAWEFTIIAETPDGRRREERTILGVYPVVDLACGDSVPLETEEGYFDGDFYAFYDPRGYAVYRVPLEGLDPSQITLTVTGSEGHYLGLATPDPGWLKFYGGADRIYVNSAITTLDVDPRSYPAVKHYLEAEELYFSAGSIGVDMSMTVSVACDMTPRPNLAGLPVIQPLAATSHTLASVGGQPPIRWAAEGLPNGLVLDEDGTLHGQTGAIGTYVVDLTVTDKLGASDVQRYMLYVGNDEACAPYRKIACGGVIEGTFTTAYFNDANGADSTRTFCIVNDSDDWLGYEIYSDDGELRLDIADPGATDDEMFFEGKGTYAGWVERDMYEGVPVDPFSWPNIEDYQDLPVLLSIRAYEPGDWSVHLTCQ